MSFILNIDTTTETALVNIAKAGHVIHEEINPQQKDHAAFLHTAIQSALHQAGIGFNELDAISVSIGPGSYTGIRVGMSSAKGLSYTLNKPLITLNTLEILAKDAADSSTLIRNDQPVLYCPMIDARRMEVFTALYDGDLGVAAQPTAMILDENSFVKELLNNNIIFFGNGAHKWQQLCVHENAFFTKVNNKGLAMSSLSYKKLQQNNFSAIAYSEPLYIKEFYNPSGNI
jgi:tRNA threonylcarbamoyladenosine biosynthesis protein TsaB